MEIRFDKVTTPFNLERTLCCGQVFRWEKIGGWWYGVTSGKVVKVRQTRNGLAFQGFPQIDVDFIKRYFRLDDDLLRIFSRINKDKHIDEAIMAFRGLRLIRQEPWECLISYMCATYKNIPAIQKMILNLSRRFGEKITADRHDFYTFPRPIALAEADLEDVGLCGLGFRMKRVLEVSRRIAQEKFDLKALRKMDYATAKRELLALQGVGPKVADCVLLFSLDKLEAFPVDVWMKRIILKFYRDHFESGFIRRVLGKTPLTRGQYEKVNSFGRKYFGKYAGYAQEYLFHFGRQQLF
jgi:N-glycosylase/DNA lyase